MATCKDCIHYLVCDYWEKEAYPNDCENYDKALCKFFKNKADFVEVVRCKDCKYA